ncbi:hypothetical protein Ciccas_007166 [Cichlidogyrus casuarinus]|uniref:Uncharacterized protein n=1 Tax=Cichlidogyrus casuarinus TaxID=1844966 RepID=A0ABD2Q4B6_9PLAT
MMHVQLQSLVNGNGVATKDGCGTGPSKEIDVISYCLSHLTPSSPDFEEHKKTLEKELATYKADVYCFQNAEPDCQTFLRDLLKKQACTFSTISGSNLIAFQLDTLTLLSQHRVSALDFAKQVVTQCAYPASWCRSIQAALACSHFDEMLVTVLMHKATNQVILVASHSLNKKEVRPDITALNITGALWSLARIWQEQNLPTNRNGQTKNGCEINGHPKPGVTSPRWLLCGPFNASERSPIYQLARDGYPNDITLDRLRCLKNINLPSHVSLHVPPIDPELKDTEQEEDCSGFKNKALIDLLWNAFQHPCTDVTSCYQAVVGREPPFTRLTCDRKTTTGPRDYIWCSGTTLQPHTVLMPPCRGLASLLNGKGRMGEASAIPLMARMSLVPTCS